MNNGVKLGPVQEGKSSVLLIYTGGTIGMAQKEFGLSPVQFENIVDEVPELSRLGYNLEAITFSEPIDSSNMQPEIWAEIANIVKENYTRFDGFVVLHGTDTMAYTASALSFMLHNLSKPVIFTGSQLPIGVLRTDGKENLITSIEIAAAKNENGESMVPEVCVYFDFKLMRANRTVKRHSDHFSAFHSPNLPLLAKAGVDIKYYTDVILKSNKKPLEVCTKMDTNVVILRLFPGMTQLILESIINITNIKGIVIEAFGSGNVPTNHWFAELIKKAVKKGILIVIVTQCDGGVVKIGRYASSKELLEAGVVNGKDMTTEAAITKLMYLLANKNKYNDIKTYLGQSLIGEIIL